MGKRRGVKVGEGEMGEVEGRAEGGEKMHFALLFLAGCQ